MRLEVGISVDEDVGAAVSTAAREALGRCRAPALAVVFCTSEYDAEAVAEAANRAFASLPWVGAVTAAVLVTGRVLARGLAVGVVDCDGLRVRVGAAGPTPEGAREAGRRAAREALEGMPLPPPDRSRAMLLFADAEVDSGEVLHGALSVAGSGVAWCGGAFGDTAALPEARASLFARGLALRGHVVAVALDCPARVGVGIRHGWQPTGAPAMVTRAKGRSLELLEHRPAIDIYRAAAKERGQAFAEQEFAAFAMSHPIGIPQADGEYLIRDPLAVDAAGALHFLASVPDGALVRVMEGTPEMLVEAARGAASMAREDVGGPLGGALVFDCISRYVMLGDRLADELAACQRALGEGVQLLGCLTFGEIGAFGSRTPQFHNKTMVVLALPA